MHSSHSITVNSWSELLEALYRDSWNEKLGRHQSPYVFRALEDRNYRLSSALHRLGDPSAEKKMLNQYKRYSNKQPAIDDYWHWLAQAQQDGLPTRLLSWSYSPLVALHFAVANPAKYNIDAVLWAVNYQEAKYYWPDQLALKVEPEIQAALAIQELEGLAEDAEGLQQLKRKDYALFLESPINNEMSRNQALLYALMSDDQRMMDDWLRAKKINYFRIIIPAALKQEVRDKLDQANIHEQILFPDQAGLARWLKRQYQKKEKTKPNSNNGIKSSTALDLGELSNTKKLD
jgi:hypothetical protein